MLGFEKLYLVDYHQELLDELARNFRAPMLVFVRNNGTDFAGIPADSVDFVFSFGVFVHLDLNIIEEYLKNLITIVKLDSQIVLQYSDKTKPAALANPTFSMNDPDTMRRLVSDHGYRLVREDLTTLPHSSIVQFTRDRASSR